MGVGRSVSNSWAQPGRDRWEAAARACYEGFQHGSGDLLGSPLELDIAPLSFLMLDSRTDRDRDMSRLLRPEVSTQVADWADRVARDSRFVAAVVVTGQSLLEDEVSAVTGSIADYALANYKKPYQALLRALGTIAGAGKQVLLLTGDVHWGRVTTVGDRQRVPEATVFHELISSPASLVETIGADQVATAIGVVKGWFGADDPWPRHGDAVAPPPHLPHADHVMNIMPQNAESDRFFDARRFGLMKPGATFYNIGRGTTVDQMALLGAMVARRIAAAYLDVTDPEPLPADHPLWTTPNCFITPHTAGGSADEFSRLGRHFIDNVKRFNRGEQLEDRVF